MAGRIILETSRVWLREFTADDAEAFRPLITDERVVRYTGDGGNATVEEVRAGIRARMVTDYADRGFGRWACVLKETGAVIGFNGLKFLDDLNEVDIGYRFLPEYWGRGLAMETSRPVLDFGFGTLQLQQIIGLVMPENLASVRVLEKLGMRLDGMVAYRSGQVARYVIHARDHKREMAS